MNRLPCIAMCLVSLELFRYINNCWRWSSQGVTFKTIMPEFMDFSLSWSCIMRIPPILRLNPVFERSLLLLSLFEALIPQSPLRSKDLYWVSLTFRLSPQPSLSISRCQPGLLFYHHLHLTPCIIWLYNIAIFQFQGKGVPQRWWPRVWSRALSRGAVEGVVKDMMASHSLYVSDNMLIRHNNNTWLLMHIKA